MSSLTRLATVAALWGGLLVVGSPALADTADPGDTVGTSTTTTLDGAGISSAGLASRASSPRCTKRDTHRAGAKRPCGRRSGGR